MAFCDRLSDWLGVSPRPPWRTQQHQDQEIEPPIRQEPDFGAGKSQSKTGPLNEMRRLGALSVGSATVAVVTSQALPLLFTSADASVNPLLM